MDYILEMKNISKSFPGAQVLWDVNFNIKKGEVHALMGENGAGKSTLMKILMGIYSCDKGEIILNGSPVTMKNPHEAIKHGVSMIHQELNPILDMQVFENVFIGREHRRFGFLADKRRMSDETQALFDELEIPVRATAYMRDLSVAKCQLVEIAKAISVRAQVIIMDEPTSAITESEVDILFKQISRLKAQGVSVIYISHKIAEIFRICDTITVLRDGKWISTAPAAEMSEDKLIKMMVGRDISEVYPKETVTIGETVLEAKNMCLGRKVRNVSISVRKGEILGIAGLVGAGRSELVETIFGLNKADAGEIYINGKRRDMKNPRAAIRQKMALITEDRKMKGLVLSSDIKDNICLMRLKDFAKAGVISGKRESGAADEYIKKLRIRPTNRSHLVRNLSGGNQQKVVLAKWLLCEPEIVILDDPTRGIDVGAKRDIYLLMGELVQAGKAIVLISSEISELIGMSDRIVVMAEGVLTGELRREEFSQEKIMGYAAKFATEQSIRDGGFHG
jgi:ABC-type sugar transport system ATPase subunit